MNSSTFLGINQASLESPRCCVVDPSRQLIETCPRGGKFKSPDREKAGLVAQLERKKLLNRVVGEHVHHPRWTRPAHEARSVRCRPACLEQVALVDDGHVGFTAGCKFI